MMLKEVVFSEAGRRVSFQASGGPGGVSDTLGIWKEKAMDAATVELTTTTLGDILARTKAPTFIHFMSLDIEGAELESLKAFFFDTHKLGALAVEHNYESPKRDQIEALMKSHGYVRFHAWAQDRLLCTGPRTIAERRRFAFGCTVELPKRAIFAIPSVFVPSRLPEHLTGRERASLIVGFAVLVLLLTWPQALNPSSVPAHRDAWFSMWRLAWIAHQLRTDPVRLFDANIYYPSVGTLAYSDATLIQGLLAAPFLWLGVPTPFAYTLLVLGSFMFAGLAMCALVRYSQAAPGQASRLVLCSRLRRTGSITTCTWSCSGVAGCRSRCWPSTVGGIVRRYARGRPSGCSQPRK